MALFGSSVPLSNGGHVVTVICPNRYSHERLMQALNEIAPEAGDPPKPPTNEQVTAYLDRQDEDDPTSHLKAGEAERES